VWVVLRVRFVICCCFLRLFTRLTQATGWEHNRGMVYLKLFGVMLLGGTLFGQEFEVASIRQVDMSLGEILRAGRFGVNIDDSTVELRAHAPIALIQLAFGVLRDQVLNMPDSSNGLFFDVKGRIPPGVSKDRVPQMLQALLAERFKLVVHRQEVSRPIYHLTAADGARKLQPSTSTGPGRCSLEGARRKCVGMTMGELADLLTNMAQIATAVANSPNAAAAGLANVAVQAQSDWLVTRPVFNKTGIEGRFDFAFDYGRTMADPTAPPVRVVDSLAALGLKLEPDKMSTQNVIVDRMERLPTEN